MKNIIFQKITDIMTNKLQLIYKSDIKEEDTLLNTGFDSISFIKLIVELEREFDVSFDDVLSLDYFRTFDDLIFFIESNSKS